MKKLLLAFTTILAAGIGIVSCNNGPYDAKPDVDLSGAQNPASSDSGTAQVYLGSLETVLNNKSLVFSPAFYFIDEMDTYHFIARVKDDSIFRRTLRIEINPYDGVRTYEVAVDTDIFLDVNFTMLDTSRVDLAGRDIFKTYSASYRDGFGYAIINFEGDEGGHIRGNLNCKLHRSDPEKVLEDTVSMQFSPFYFEKVPFPVPGEYIDYLVK